MVPTKQKKWKLRSNLHRVLQFKGGAGGDSSGCYYGGHGCRYGFHLLLREKDQIPDVLESNFSQLRITSSWEIVVTVVMEMTTIRITISFIV